jgi:hypothetical protein
VRYELGFYIPEDDILHSHRRGNLKSYKTSLFETLAKTLLSESEVQCLYKSSPFTSISNAHTLSSHQPLSCFPSIPSFFPSKSFIAYPSFIILPCRHLLDCTNLNDQVEGDFVIVLNQLSTTPLRRRWVEICHPIVTEAQDAAASRFAPRGKGCLAITGVLDDAEIKEVLLPLGFESEQTGP